LREESVNIASDLEFLAGCIRRKTTAFYDAAQAGIGVHHVYILEDMDQCVIKAITDLAGRVKIGLCWGSEDPRELDDDLDEIPF
jgi:hypothetical protein